MRKEIIPAILILLIAIALTFTAACGPEKSDAPESTAPVSGSDDDDEFSPPGGSDDDDDFLSDDDDDGDDDDDLVADVVILDDGVTGEDLVEILADAGIEASIWGLESEYNGQDLESSVVLLIDGGADVWGNDMPLPGQQALAEMLENGGSLLVTEWVLWDIQNGHYSALQPFIPAAYGTGSNTGPESFHVQSFTHPITQGLDADFSVGAISYSNVVATGGSVLITGDQSGDAIIADGSFGGKLVYCAFAGSSDGYDGALDPWTEPMKTLMANIVNWLIG
jgi:hypothetical protein